MSVKKKKSPLNLKERILIEIKYRDGCSLRSIAKELDRNVSTISREINGKPHIGSGKYIAYVSHKKALKRIDNRGNISKIDKYEKLKDYVVIPFLNNLYSISLENFALDLPRKVQQYYSIFSLFLASSKS